MAIVLTKTCSYPNFYAIFLIMETIISIFTLVFFIILPCIAIFSFTSSLTRGIYNWSERQNNMKIEFTPQWHPRREMTPEEEEQMLEEYFGYAEEIEDSDEMKDRLDEIEFDFRNYMRSEDAKRNS